MSTGNQKYHCDSWIFAIIRHTDKIQAKDSFLHSCCSDCAAAFRSLNWFSRHLPYPFLLFSCSSPISKFTAFCLWPLGLTFSGFPVNLRIHAVPHWNWPPGEQNCLYTRSEQSDRRGTCAGVESTSASSWYQDRDPFARNIKYFKQISSHFPSLLVWKIFILWGKDSSCPCGFPRVPT